MDTTNTFSRLSITNQLALQMINAAQLKAGELKMGISITIVDESGNTKAFSRMDNAPLVSIDISRKKALTAVGMGMATGADWYNFIKDDPILAHGANNIKDFTMFGGGIPITIENTTIGAIGISGGHYKQDEICANAALAIINQ